MNLSKKALENAASEFHTWTSESEAEGLLSSSSNIALLAMELPSCPFCIVTVVLSSQDLRTLGIGQQAEFMIAQLQVVFCTDNFRMSGYL